MESYEAKKHWFHWVMPVIFSILLCWTIIIPIWLLLYTFLRIKFDKIEVKEGCLYSRMGLIIIDKKTIPLEQISFISIKADILSEMMHMGSIEVQSSAFAKAIRYLWIKEPQNLIDFINRCKKEK